MKKTKSNVGMYIIDSDYTIVGLNNTLSAMYPEVKIGDKCYLALAKSDSPCNPCPRIQNSMQFFNPVLKQWINAQAAEMEYPEHGSCYCVQFTSQNHFSGSKYDLLTNTDKIAAHIAEVQAFTGGEGIICAYCEQGSPIFYANEKMASYAGCESLAEMMEFLDGMSNNLVHPDDLNKVASELTGAKIPGTTFESGFRTARKNGSWTPIVFKGKYIEMDDGRLATVCAFSDIGSFLKHHTVMYDRHTELQKKDTLIESLINKIPGSYHCCSTDEGYPFLYISETFEETVGWTKQEIAKLFDNKFINLVYPEDLCLFDDLVEQIDDKGQGSTIYRLKSRDGGYRWVQDSTMMIEVDGDSFYQCTLADITPHIEEVEAAKARAEANSKAKSTFLFNASHDIRTPMNAIHGFTQMLKRNPENIQMVRETVAKIEKAGDTLMKLLNDVLELSRIESGKEEVSLSVIDLEEHYENLLVMLRGEDSSVNLSFIKENHITCRRIWCDELKLTQIAMNMLSNAKKFTSDGGTVTFGVEQTPAEEANYGYFKFYVRDTGIGMSEEFLNRAFEQFEREKTATESGITGSGLGLSIIKKLTELLGGECSLHSELGKGTEISATIKCRIADDLMKESPSVPEKTVDFSGKRILLVEDNDFNREIARFVLEDMGILVEEAENGYIALNMLMASKAGYYDLVLMDIQMPVMDGYTATKEIRCIKDPSIASVPIIAMTANAFKEDEEQCIKAGMNNHLGKPIDIRALQRVMAEVLNKRNKGGM